MRRKHGPYSEYFGTDHVWPALDAKGFVGLFITGGWAAIPRVVQTHPLMLEVASRSAPLPAGALCWLDPRSAAAPSIIGLAPRGFYVYDWGDASSTHAYTRVAIPAFALHMRDLPADLAACLPNGLQLPISFAETREIDVREYVDCLQSEG